MEQQILFSLCHTTIRLPEGWRRALQMWKDRADHPELVEHVFVTDQPEPMSPIFENTIIAVNEGPKSCVAGWNRAAEVSRGKFIINVADDLFPPEHWDTELLKVVNFDEEQVVEVNTGGNHGLLTFCMVTRPYYERYGYLLYPEYLSVYSDNEFTDQARRDGVVVNARHLLFRHEHPLYDPNVPTDSAYEWQSRPEAWKVGRELYLKRSRKAGMNLRKKIAICMPGEQFSTLWVSNWTNLLASLIGRYELVPIFGFASNVYVTRATMAHNVSLSKPYPDYVLWIDDDNILSYDHLALMIQSLERHPEVSSISGWSWIQPDGITIDERVSCGTFDEQGGCVALRHKEMMEALGDLIQIEWTGFPAVLMRYSMLEALGSAKAFQPLEAPGHPYGFYGEDSSFSMRAKQAGLKMFVDRRIRLPHLKLRDAVPIQPTIEVGVEATL